MMNVQLSLLEVSSTPTGVPVELWNLFCADADAIRATGRKHYSARCICEAIRHSYALRNRGAEYLLNNNLIPVMARAYMVLRDCPRFFETREKHYMNSEAA
jgi:hypothetical protein